MCSSQISGDASSFLFDNPAEFHLYETRFPGNQRGPSVQILGEVRIRPGTDQAGANVRVDVDYHVSDHSLMSYIYLERLDSGLKIVLPDSVWGLHQPCLSIIATIWVPPGLAIDNMVIETINLGIQYHPSLNYTVHNTTSISSISGPIHMSSPLPDFYSRKTIIRTTSGSVTGSYPLYDLLSIDTASGSVQIDVDPREAAKNNPAPAEFIVNAASASVQAHYPIYRPVADIPDRDYRVSIRTMSGSIRGTYLHGSTSSFDAISGSIVATLAPYGPVSRKTNIHTSCQSSSTHLTVCPSLTEPDAPMRNLHSLHEYSSGSLRLHFPAMWEGAIEGRTMSGSINVHWEGVRIIRQGREGFGPWKYLLARKGDEQAQGRIEFRGMSGSMDLEGD